MSRVFAARDIKLDRRVAIKFLATGTHHDDELRRFEQEARAAGSLNHPNVLIVHDIGTHEGNPYIVSELLEGGTLREHLDGAPLVLERAIDYAAQLADGLAAAHERRIVHRDLKPENLFITRDGRLKILDFGIAKLMAREGSKPELKSPAQTQTGVVLGTMGYMSPEQVRGEHADPRSDIFSAGTILYEMLSRKRAFEASSLVETAYAILNENPPELPEQVPDDLREVVWRCLEKKPEERFQSSTELGFDLRKLSTPVSIGNQTHSSSEEAKRVQQTRTPRARRWLGWPFATTAIVVLLIAFISVVSVGRWRERLLGSARRTDVPAAASKSRRSVAVLGFKNLSGRPEEAWFSSALSEMLTTELAAGEKLRTIPGESVSHMKTELALPHTETLAKETLLRIHKNLLADLVVLGSFVHLGKEAGGQMRLDVRLQDAVAGETIAVFSETGTEKSLFDLVSRAGANLRKKLGVGDVSPSEAAVVRASLPADVEAARLYSEGLAKLRVFDAIEARDLLEKAVLLEPTHAPSHSALSEAWSTLGYDAKARDEAKKAFDLSATLSREDRLRIEGRYRLTTYEWSKAIDVYQTLLDFFPDNVDYGIRLARAQISAGKGKEALATVEALSKLPPPKGQDTRIDVVEAEASESISDFKREQEAAARAVAKGELQEAKLLVATAQLKQGNAFQRLRDPAKARSAYEEAQQIYAAAGNRADVAKVSSNIGNLLRKHGDLAGAKARYEEALAVFREVGNPFAATAVLNNIGNVLALQGDLEGAKRAQEQALALSEELGHKKGMAEAQGMLGMVLVAEGSKAEAKRRFQESITNAREIGDRVILSQALRGLGSLLREEGDLAAAKESFQQELAIHRDTGDQTGIAQDLHNLGLVLLDQGDLTGARKSAERALAVSQQLGDNGGAAHYKISLASLALAEGRPSEAEALIRQAVEQLPARHRVDVEAGAWAILSKSLLAQGEAGKAQEALARAVELAGKIKVRVLDLEVAIVSARIRAAMGNFAEAKKSLRATLAGAERYGVLRCQLQARLALGEIDMKSGHSVAGRAQLQATERDATAHGFGLIARNAVAARK
jgi:serine/threonine protein kinase/tetratricopeptide (TPR) repeat protein